MKPNLEDIAARIRDEHGAAVRAFNSGIEHALRCGELLIEAKAAVDHGGWLPWLEITGLSERSAQRYMKLARGRQTLESANVADLTLNAALALIKGEQEPTPPDEFPLIEPGIARDFCCPSCWYRWNGDPLAGDEAEKNAPDEERRRRREKLIAALPSKAA